VPAILSLPTCRRSMILEISLTPAHMNHSSHGIWRPQLFISFVCTSMITQRIEQASYTIIILGASLPFFQCVLCVRQSRTHWDTFVLALLCILMALTVLYLLYSPRAVSTSCYHNLYSNSCSHSPHTQAVQSFPFFVFLYGGRRMDGKWQFPAPWPTKIHINLCNITWCSNQERSIFPWFVLWYFFELEVPFSVVLV
jgi:hypothetical protein